LVTTETIDLYTTVCPITTVSTITKKPETTTSMQAPLTTSTVYTTKTYTITSCAPGVSNCPAGKVTTEVIALYTTVCPVAQSSAPAKPTTTSCSKLTTTSKTTSYVYTTITVPAGGKTYSTLAGTASYKPTTAASAGLKSSPICSGAGCPALPSKVVTAGAGKVAFSLGGVIAVAALLI
jgi:chitinase